LGALTASSVLAYITCRLIQGPECCPGAFVRWKMKTQEVVYKERISSNKTLFLFVKLMLLFGALSARSLFITEKRGWGIAFSCISLFFLFYVFNYRVLVIQVDENALRLKFGLFTWRIPLSNIETSFLDKTSLWRIGGAGIHFSPIGGRYRAMFNFLEYDRVVIALKEKKGLVRDVAFATTRPDEVMRLLVKTPPPVL
jgi:hypothetical protein